jgi:hypothetical protein
MIQTKVTIEGQPPNALGESGSWYHTVKQADNLIRP